LGAQDQSFLDKELHQVARDAEFGRQYADKLAKVWRLNGAEEWVLVHIEVQGKPERTFDRRMYTYNYRLYDRYGCASTASLAVVNDNGASRKSGQPWLSSLWGVQSASSFRSRACLSM
jgi:hypothetical protein